MDYWEQMDARHGRDYLLAELDSYNPDPMLAKYLHISDMSASNDELGLNEKGERDDD